MSGGERPGSASARGDLEGAPPSVERPAAGGAATGDRHRIVPGDGETAAASSPDDGAPLPVIRPDWAAPARVTALCTTRAGGVSAPPHDALNLGLHVGDDPARVHENRRRLAAALALPATPRWLVQVHGTRIVRVDGADGGGRDGVGREDALSGSPEADGAWTDRAGVVLGVLTADCLPVVVTDADGTRVALAHAGWRGLAGGVLEAALAPFEPESELHVWLGPAIGPGAFEVGPEVREAFLARDAAHEGAFVPCEAPGKFLADLYALARTELARGRTEGALRVYGGAHCTVTEAARFHSYRRDGARSGRMATLAWIG